MSRASFIVGVGLPFDLAEGLWAARAARLIGVLALVCATVQVQAQTSASLPDLTAPLSLQQCIDMAWERHPNVALARLAADAARANAIQQRSLRYPRLQLRWSARESQSLGRPVDVGGGVIRTTASRSTQRNAELALDYTIYESGRKSRIDRAKTSAEASEYGIADARRLLAYEVTTAYWAIVAAEEYAVVALNAVANAERHRELVEARIDAGVAPEADLWPVKVEVSQARLEAVRADTELHVTHAGLRALLGLPAGADLRVADGLVLSAYDSELDALLAIAEQQRPDLAERRLGVRAAQLGLKTAEVEDGVKFSAGVSGDYGRHTGTTGDTWQASIAATYPLFDAGASNAQVASARADVESARWRLAALMLNIQEEVEAAHLRLRQAAAVIEAASLAREDAQNSLEAAEARYQEGLAFIIEVTDAQLALLRAQVAQVQAQYDYAIASAALCKAVSTDIIMLAGDVQ